MKKFKTVLAMALVLSCSVTAFAATPNTTSNEVVVVSNSINRMKPTSRMPIFGEWLETSGIYAYSKAKTTKDAKIMSGAVDALDDYVGWYVSKVTAKIKQGNTTNTGDTVSDGIASAKITNNPLQSQYMVNSWVVKQ